MSGGPRVTVAIFGDVVGEPGMRAFEHGAATIKARHSGAVIIVNGENARGGSGLSPELYKRLRRAGADAVTLGDHAYKEPSIIECLDDPSKPVARPANMGAGARGKTSVVINGPAPLALITVLGRLYMPAPGDDPFHAVDREIAAVIERAPDAAVIVEVHAEATSEKQAIAWHCVERWSGRVVAVVGTHTHVQTADARILGEAIGAMTDLGMCGGHGGVIGRRGGPVVEHMRSHGPRRFEPCDEGLEARGCLLTYDPAARQVASIELLVIPFAS